LNHKSRNKWVKNKGCMSQAQIGALKTAVKRAWEDPSLLCDLEGCGPIAELENAFSRICATRFALALSSGTAAIHTALLAARIGPGDEVIVTPYSWAQSVAPVLFTGATPVFADINPRTLTLDPESVRKRISPRTRAILPVHLFGHPADISQLEELARKAGALIISDAAHAMGARIDGAPIGTFGNISCFSLGRGKLISAGEGGIITTNDEDIFERAVSLTQHPERVRRIKGPGRKEEVRGLNYRLHPITALLALSDLKVFEEKMSHRMSILEAFWDGLGNQDAFSAQSLLCREDPAPYGIALSYEKDNGRDEFVTRMQEKGVPIRCGPVNIPLHLRLRNKLYPQVPFHSSQTIGSCPVAEEHCKKKELWVLSALDMDGVSAHEAYNMGVMTRNEAARFFLFDMRV
jgi:perosamine synthetase